MDKMTLCMIMIVYHLKFVVIDEIWRVIIINLLQERSKNRVKNVHKEKCKERKEVLAYEKDIE